MIIKIYSRKIYQPMTLLRTQNQLPVKKNIQILRCSSERHCTANPVLRSSKKKEGKMDRNGNSSHTKSIPRQAGGLENVPKIISEPLTFP